MTVIAVAPIASVATFLGTESDLLIGGERVPSHDGGRFDVLDPASGARLATAPMARAADVDRAVRAARAAFAGEWAGVTPADRAAALWRLADLIEARFETFAQLEALNVGKVLALSRAVDVTKAIGVLRYMAGWATKLDGGQHPVSLPGQWLAYSRREPLGVVAAIIPWNYPIYMLAAKLAPALAAGNTVVLKPAEQTPLTALLFAGLVEEAGFPPGVVNIITGDGATTGAALVSHPGVDKITFTGSTQVGKAIARQAAARMARVSLELGGKPANLIFADADLDLAIPAAAAGVFANNGQVCMAGSRLYVDRRVFDEVVGGIGAIAERTRLGHPLDPRSEMGPLISAGQRDRVAAFLSEGLADGARIAGQGRAPGGAGNFVPPTVLVGTTPAMRVQREEIFGPVVTVVPFTDADTAVAMANDSRLGLVAGCFTTNLSTAHRVSAALRAGTVFVNCWGRTDMNLPFGGVKQSGWGRELGREGVEAFTETKSVLVSL
ncbi:aldehyde dehydrogenase family protein [Dactylosporangium sp. CA-092794]|uniref:aldehyde dehydrogenase family protein n=1 Tax=Dactylosporangium sp. CA-092794 TaxID=3239929 RepID=UPI003D8A3CE1